MCRWLAYSGSPVRLNSFLVRPDHSLIDQSMNAREGARTTNGDGFGVGWYGDAPQPGAYHSTHPAWNDANLHDLAAHVHSPMFMAHVRAATGTAVQNTNCHPFRFENWLFQHNGEIPDFHRIKRTLMIEVASELFPSLQGSTDSELLFYLALTFGLRDDPPQALKRMIGFVEKTRQQANIDASLYATVAVSDGERLFALRYSSCGQSSTLYHSRHLHALREVSGTYESLPEGGVVVLSEPLDELKEHWEAIGESTIISVENGRIEAQPLVPCLPAAD